jgi:hypothetical protein
LFDLFPADAFAESFEQRREIAFRLRKPFSRCRAIYALDYGGWHSAQSVVMIVAIHRHFS